MSEISNTIANAIGAATSRAARNALGPRVGSLASPVIGQAIDQVRGAVANTAFGQSVGLTASGGSRAPGDAHGGINARGDALQNWCWYALLPDISDGGIVTSLPWYYAQTATLPRRLIQSDSANFNGHPVHFPESYSVDQLRLGLFMDTTNRAQAWLAAWEGLVLGNDDPTNPRNHGMWGLPADYKKTIDIVILNTERREMLNVKYINAWPSQPEAQELVSGSGEAMVQNVSFMVEDVQIQIMDGQEVANAVRTARDNLVQFGVTTGLSASGISNVLNQIGINLSGFL